MTREEKIEIMFESILSEVERIGKLLEGKDLKKVQSGNPDLESKIQTLSDRIMNIRIPVPQSDSRPIMDKLEELMDLIQSSHSIPPPGIVSHGNLLNFSSRFGKIMIVLAILFLVSIGGNFYYVLNVPPLRETSLKYQIIYHSGNAEYLDQLDSLWQVDSIRNEYIQYINQVTHAPEINRELWK